MHRFQIILQSRLAVFGFGARLIRRLPAQERRSLAELRLRSGRLAARHLRRYAIGFDLRGIVRRADFETRLHARGATGLLHDVRQLMGKQTPPLGALRRITPRIEGDVRSDGVCLGTYLLGGVGCEVVRMNLYLAKIMAEPRRKIFSCRGVERSAGRAQHFVYACRRQALGFSSLVQMIFLARIAVPAQAGSPAAGAFALKQGCMRRRRHSRPMSVELICALSL